MRHRPSPDVARALHQLKPGRLRPQRVGRGPRTGRGRAHYHPLLRHPAREAGAMNRLDRPGRRRARPPPELFTNAPELSVTAVDFTVPPQALQAAFEKGHAPVSNQYPGPNQPHGQQPYQGQPYPGPYPQGTAPYQPPPPPKKGMSGGAIVAIVLGSVFGGLFLILGLGAAISDDSSTSTKKPVGSEVAKKQPASGDGKVDAKPADKPAAEPEPPAPVQVTAKKATFKPSILHDGGDFTSVQVTVANNSDEKISINPLNFAITDTTGTKHSAELGQDKNQIDTMDLDPGEKATGVITGKGAFTPKYVTYTDGWFGDGVRGNVS